MVSIMVRVGAARARASLTQTPTASGPGTASCVPAAINLMTDFQQLPGLLNRGIDAVTVGARTDPGDAGAPPVRSGSRRASLRLAAAVTAR